MKQRIIMRSCGAVLMLICVGMRVQLASGSLSVYTCFTCNSTLTKNCNDPFNPNGLSTCNGLSCTKKKWENQGVSSVSRDCQAFVGDPIGCVEMSMWGSKGIGCTCAGDKCNSAPAAAYVQSLRFLTLIFINSLASIEFVVGR